MKDLNLSEQTAQNFTTEQIQQFSATFTQLRSAPSHYKQSDDNQQLQENEWNEQVDAYDSPMHQAMKALGEFYGKPDTPAHSLLDAMGEPDEMTSDIHQPFQSPSFMPGPVVSEKEGGEEEGKVYLCYYWRGRHDFLWFKLKQADELIETSGWFNALE